MTRHALQQFAMKAFKNHVDWQTFWPTIESEVKAFEPYSTKRWHRVVSMLMMIVLTGTTDGQFAAGDPDALPWLDDDNVSNTIELLLRSNGDAALPWLDDDNVSNTIELLLRSNGDAALPWLDDDNPPLQQGTLFDEVTV